MAYKFRAVGFLVSLRKKARIKCLCFNQFCRFSFKCCKEPHPGVSENPLSEIPFCYFLLFLTLGLLGYKCTASYAPRRRKRNTRKG